MATVPLVPGHPLGTPFRTTPRRAFDRPILEQLIEDRGFMRLAGGQDEVEQFAIPFGPQMHFGAEAALTPS